MLRLTLARAAQAPGQEGASKSFDRPRITIGRAPENDWALPDPDRHLSKTHCVIEFVDGRYFITDTSTNGVFLNQSPDPLGRDSRAVLNDGDRIDLGGYLIEARIENKSATPELDPLAAGPARDHGDEQDPFGLNQPPPQATASGPSYDESNAGMRAGGSPIIPDFDDFDDLFEGLGKPDGDRRAPPPAGDVFGPPPSRIEEADIFGVRPDPNEWDRSEADHAPSRAEFFKPPNVVSTPIPDDWDDLLPSTPPPPFPTPTAEAPPPQPPRPAIIPDPSELPDVEPFTPPSSDGAKIVPEPLPAPTEPVMAERTTVPRPLPSLPEASPPPTVPEPARHIAERPRPAAPTAQRSEPGQSIGAGTALDAFLAGAGLSPDALRLTNEEAERTMRMAGKAFRHMVEGLREVLMARSAIKNEFRVERTMIRAADNNPLKFSVSAEEALFTLLRPVVAGYLPADRAVEEGLKDIKAHQLATMAGMQVAITTLLAQFDPEELKKRLDQKSVLDSILPGSKKARYWELYEKLYREIAKSAEDNFHGSYGREFARAYEEQVRKL